MDVREAQREMREVFVGGAIGQTVSGLIWLISAALGNWVDFRYGIAVLVVGGAFIFPLTQLSLKIIGHAASARRENPLNGLAMQIAFIIPACLPVIYAAAMYNINWFYPAFMVVVGAHYLPFISLYGLKRYGVLAAALIGGGILIGFTRPEDFASGGWFGGAVLLLFAIEVSKSLEEAAASSAAAAEPAVTIVETPELPASTEAASPNAEAAHLAEAASSPASDIAREVSPEVEAAAEQAEEQIEAWHEVPPEAFTSPPAGAPEIEQPGPHTGEENPESDQEPRSPSAP